jgi:hypothetical protein
MEVAAIPEPIAMKRLRSITTALSSAASVAAVGRLFDGFFERRLSSVADAGHALAHELHELGASDDLRAFDKTVLVEITLFETR